MPIKINKNLIVVIIVIVALIVIAFLFQKGKLGGAGLSVSSQQAAERAIGYINNNILAGGGTASLVGVSEANGVFKVSLKIGEQGYDSYVSKDGKLLFPEGYDMDKKAVEKAAVATTTVGNFLTSEEEVCTEDGKPIVYFFGSTGCPHCKWEHPILENVLKNFEGLVSFHNNMDSQNDSEVFSKYSDGGIPTLVFGCKYYRMGSGEGEGEENETNALTAMLCKLTNNQPSEVCKSVEDLVNQIK